MRSYSISVQREDARALLEELSRRAPHAMVGYDASTGYIKARYNSSKCIHKKYDNWDDGNPIHLWDCSAGSTANKTWKID